MCNDERSRVRVRAWPPISTGFALINLFLFFHPQLPPVTRTYVTLCILTTAACALEVGKERKTMNNNRDVFFHSTNPIPFFSLPQLIAPFNIYYNARLIFQKGEVWRLVTAFLYFGSLS